MYEDTPYILCIHLFYLLPPTIGYLGLLQFCSCYNQCQNRHPCICIFVLLSNYFLWLNPVSGIEEKGIYFFKAFDDYHQAVLQKEWTT